MVLLNNSSDFGLGLQRGKTTRKRYWRKERFTALGRESSMTHTTVNSERTLRAAIWTLTAGFDMTWRAFPICFGNTSFRVSLN